MQRSLKSPITRNMELNDILRHITDLFEKQLNIQELRDIKIVVGLSGGADSMLMYKCLKDLAEKYRFNLIPVHVNHLIREGATDQAKILARYIKDKYDDRLFVISFDAVKYSKKFRCSLEEAGRQGRKKIFNKILEDKKARFIALGHNLDDNVETIIYRLCRGTGIFGLRGMTFQEGLILRPLIYLRRELIREIVRKESLFYLEDESNLDDRFTRNRIRLHIVPELLKINHKALEHIGALCEDARAFEDIIKKEISLVLKELHMVKTKDFIILKLPQISNDFLMKELFREIIKIFKGDLLKTERYHLDEFLILLKSKASFSLNFPDDLVFEKGFDYLLIRPKGKSICLTDKEIDRKTIDLEHNLGRFFIEGDELALKEDFKNYRIRAYQPGDRLENKAIKKIFQDKKVPRFLRAIIPLMTIQNMVIYSPFFHGDNVELSCGSRKYKINFKEGALYSKINIFKNFRSQYE